MKHQEWTLKLHMARTSFDFGTAVLFDWEILGEVLVEAIWKPLGLWGTMILSEDAGFCCRPRLLNLSLWIILRAGGNGCGWEIWPYPPFGPPGLGSRELAKGQRRRESSVRSCFEGGHGRCWFEALRKGPWFSNTACFSNQDDKLIRVMNKWAFLLLRPLDIKDIFSRYPRGRKIPES